MDAFHSGVFIALFVIRVVIVAVVTVLQYFCKFDPDSLVELNCHDYDLVYIVISLMGIGVAMLEENVREERELQDKNISMPCDTKTAEDETCANERRFADYYFMCWAFNKLFCRSYSSRRQTSSRIQQYAYLNQHPTDHYPIPLQVCCSSYPFHRHVQ